MKSVALALAFWLLAALFMSCTQYRYSCVTDRECEDEEAYRLDQAELEDINPEFLNGMLSVGSATGSRPLLQSFTPDSSPVQPLYRILLVVQDHVRITLQRPPAPRTAFRPQLGGVSADSATGAYQGLRYLVPKGFPLLAGGHE